MNMSENKMNQLQLNQVDSDIITFFIGPQLSGEIILKLLEVNKRFNTFLNESKEYIYSLFFSREEELKGNITHINHYVDGKRHGSAIELFKNKKLKSKGNYKQDRKHGIFEIYWHNGKLKNYTEYSYGGKVVEKDFERTGEPNYERIYQNRKIKLEETYIRGKLRWRRACHNGKPDGEQIGWYGNGQMMINENFCRGKRHGEKVEWYENGQVKTNENFYGGRRQGDQLEWYENGQLKEKAFYKDGKWDGEQLHWYEDGGLLHQCFFKNGEYHGPWRRFNHKGEVEREYLYEDNMIVRNRNS